MNMLHQQKTCKCCLLFILSILHSIITVTVWYFGYAPHARELMPFVLAFSLIVILMQPVNIEKQKLGCRLEQVVVRLLTVSADMANVYFIPLW